MDIDLSVLRLMEREREIPFDELVQIIEQAILTAYLKHTDTEPHGTSSRRARVELDRKTGHVAVFVPELDDEGDVIGEAESTARRLRPHRGVRRQAGHQPAAARHRATTRCSASSAAARATSSPASSSRVRTRG